MYKKILLLFVLLSALSFADTTCDSCASCDAAINDVNQPVVLTANITSTLSTCITNYNNNTVFDCNGNSITYVGANSATGYASWSGNNNLIQNCTFIDFNIRDPMSYAITFTGENGSTVRDSFFIRDLIGIYDYQSKNDSFYSNTFDGQGVTQDAGIYVDQGEDVHIQDTQASNAISTGIYLSTNSGSITETTCSMIGDCIDVVGSAFVLIDQTIADNVDSGLSVQDSGFVNVQLVDLQHVADKAIKFTNTGMFILNNTRISNSLGGDTGIFLDNASLCSIDNAQIENISTGMNFNYASIVLAGSGTDNIIQNVYTAIVVGDSDSINISNTRTETFVIGLALMDVNNSYFNIDQEANNSATYLFLDNSTGESNNVTFEGTAFTYNPSLSNYYINFLNPQNNITFKNFVFGYIDFDGPTPIASVMFLNNLVVNNLNLHYDNVKFADRFVSVDPNDPGTQQLNNSVVTVALSETPCNPSDSVSYVAGFPTSRTEVLNTGTLFTGSKACDSPNPGLNLLEFNVTHWSGYALGIPTPPHPPGPSTNLNGMIAILILGIIVVVLMYAAGSAVGIDIADGEVGAVFMAVVVMIMLAVLVAFVGI